MNLESPKVTVDRPAAYIFEQLTRVQNFEKLMPDTIAKFEVTGEESFIFALKGMPEIKLKIKDKNTPSQIVLASAHDKLPFTLTGNINNVADTSCEVQLKFQGEFNAMMSMMIKGPITKFIETLAYNMPKL
ncbi:orotate phosphoribosyltransferase [Flavobacterium cyanobacteriorum]|uniref:Orotate phosphoribosyltransferase n=1 Tax=Flavobacterium cyanobacteriorum TaxID=2022802 RepID=A0A255Z9D2_9FLAO|nr:orotate phosphoribosyltransferase [Flavobacterium cyanobacteriorum]OYQ38056.1 orotate phosphoribosyltransferase [Flavobacterium cyanobacteriorum]